MTSQANKDCAEALAEAMLCHISTKLGNGWHSHKRQALIALRLAKQDGADLAAVKLSVANSVLDFLDNIA